MAEAAEKKTQRRKDAKTQDAWRLFTGVGVITPGGKVDGFVVPTVC